MKTSSLKARGFTLIELLVVIAIIAILSGILITSLTGSKAKSRDGKRVSDIAQIQLAIEQYFDRCQKYPVPAGGTSLTGTLATDSTSGTCTSGGQSITLGNFINQLPKDPSSGNGYDYAVNSYATDASDYVLHTKFETANAAVSDSIQAGKVSWLPSSIQCNDNNNRLDYCVGSK